ncbi:hypothetical protein [Thiospirillum jenense]|uniref:Uncharacterized protein n=1 Tax=Thiospirillum jenense TaxID=1653858 RepID=A0A839HKS8_9GAMM|nr:hypothetical protein [Thiospirillum jenense]MBB1127187.1 hypothetical protein [Thiospirillum jenense]
MIAIAYFFIDLCLLRRAPQDAPASGLLLALVSIAGLVSTVLLTMTAGHHIIAGLLQSLTDYTLLFAVLWMVLNFINKRGRLIQTATALIGADTLLGLFALLPMILAMTATTDSAQLLFAGVLFLGLIAWNLLVTAHILRHALDVRLIWGVLFAILYEFLNIGVASWLG